MRVKARTKSNYQVEVDTGRHIFISDEPISKGGDDLGPTPSELLLSALAGCKIITLHMYARRKEWPLESVAISLSKEKVKASECDDCDSPPNTLVDIIRCELELAGDLDEMQRARLKEISNRCPVHRTLISETKIYTELVESVLVE